MCLSNKQLDAHILARDLISISRDGLDANKLQGFPLLYSQDLLLLRYVYDFHLDGLLLVRRCDVTDVQFRETDKFQRNLLQTENRLKRRLFRSNHAIGNFSTFLKSLASKQVVIVEDERPETQAFYIGRVSSAGSSAVKLQEFTGAGNWERETTTIQLDDITCCQIETNYALFYERHFERSSQ